MLLTKVSVPGNLEDFRCSEHHMDSIAVNNGTAQEEQSWNSTPLVLRQHEGIEEVTGLTAFAVTLSPGSVCQERNEWLQQKPFFHKTTPQQVNTGNTDIYRLVEELNSPQQSPNSPRGQEMGELCRILSQLTQQMEVLTPNGQEVAVLLTNVSVPGNQEDFRHHECHMDSIAINNGTAQVEQSWNSTLLVLRKHEGAEEVNEPGDSVTVKAVNPVRQLLHYVKNVHFKNKVGDTVYFDRNGDPAGVLDIVNWQITTNSTIQHVHVGSFNLSAPQGQEFSLNRSAIVWNVAFQKTPQSVCSESCLPGYRKASRPGQSACCFDCILCSEGEITNHSDSVDCMKCPLYYLSSDERTSCIPKVTEYLSYQDPLGAALSAVSISCSMMAAFILATFIKNRETPVVKANNREISYLLLVALLLCFLCSLLFIGYPVSTVCMFRQVSFGLIFAVSCSCVLAKTITVAIAFRATDPNSNLRRWVGPKLPYLILWCCCVLQVTICILWLSLSPPFQEINMLSKPDKIIIQCNEGSILAFWLMVGYLGILAGISLIVAFIARKLPDSFNEAKFITFSILVFITVWLSFVPAYLSTKGKLMVAVEIFAILSSSAGLLGCIFFPKCYIILLRPEMNSKECLLGKKKYYKS
ncbi:vomeronasal type-2 receptor 26-like [Protopterus annectens]|uniref:vomeronasal type-2 receptor 26-like n=1 Tax=Protopterus annectens TaxID=7888 RepID=UPI001CFAEDDD|nr:vomeronasal type-2 receptor 26-like [Protopterus annectens]